MNKFFIYLALISTLCIISCSDKEDSFQETTHEIPDTSVESRSVYECFPAGLCSPYGTGFDLSRIGYNPGLYDLSDCIFPTPTSLCSVTGYMDVQWCDNQLQILEPRMLELPDCGADATYIDWDCVRESITDQIQIWLWEFYWEGDPTVDPYLDCNFGDEIFTSTIFRNTCSTNCTTFGPNPQSRLVECGDGDACCFKKNYWCDKGDGLHIYKTEIGYYGDCGNPSVPEKEYFLDGLCELRLCFKEY